MCVCGPSLCSVCVCCTLSINVCMYVLYVCDILNELNLCDTCVNGNLGDGCLYVSL